MENVLSFRGKVTQQQLQEEMMKIGQVFKDLGVQKNDSVTTATYATKQVANEPIMDIEVLIPMDRHMQLN